LVEARKLQDILEAAGIRYDWGPVSSDGIALRVYRTDLGRAVRALDLALPSESEEAEERDYAPVCPKCHSSKIVFQSRDPEPVTGSGAMPDSKFNWSCDACGHQWKDDGIEEEADSATASGNS
jgi:hypothetical protein